MIKTVLNFLFPQKCLGCRQENEILCPKCLAGIGQADLPEASGVFAAANYQDDVLRKAVWLLKYKGVKQLAKPLAELIRQRTWTKIPHQNGIIIPIPLSSRRLRQRGYNQAELIARHLSDKIAINILFKKIHTESQVNAKEKERRLSNVKGSFAVKNAGLIKNKNIILIDDVCTTGATIREAKKILREAGAKKVLAAVVARG